MDQDEKKNLTEIFKNWSPPPEALAARKRVQPKTSVYVFAMAFFALPFFFLIILVWSSWNYFVAKEAVENGKKVPAQVLEIHRGRRDFGVHYHYEVNGVPYQKWAAIDYDYFANFSKGKSISAYYKDQPEDSYLAEQVDFEWFIFWIFVLSTFFMGGLFEYVIIGSYRQEKNLLLKGRFGPALVTNVKLDYARGGRFVELTYKFIDAKGNVIESSVLPPDELTNIKANDVITVMFDESDSSKNYPFPGSAAELGTE